MKDTKYFIAYVAPALVFFSIYMGGIWSFSAFIFAYAIIPMLELISPQSQENLNEREEENKTKSMFFDILLYLNLPILFGILWFYFSTIQQGGLAMYELLGMTLGVGFLCASIGINVAHELGHRDRKFEQLMSKTLLMSALYMHFFIEHNKGHHKNIATDEDPASARAGESLYAFWLRSVTGGYKHAWQLENQRLQKLGKPIISIYNDMIWYHIIQLGYLLTVGLLFGWMVVPFAIAAAVIGFLSLETVNYIEHYGLRRKRMPSGRYENVSPMHSWNSNHELGRIFLYELTRHSDHHFKSTRKYQVLRHFEESPQMPFGYPAAMVIATLPFLWFRLMDKRAMQVQQQFGIA